MPYFLHCLNSAPDTGTAYASKPEALAVRQDGQTVTFVASESERASWRERERARFDSGHYVQVPWNAGRLYSDATEFHFCHVSLDVPGMVAYTPDDEYGIADRQVRVKPGKYLQKFFSDRLTNEQINAYAARVKAYTSELQLARTADDIARVYVAKNGPQSCMDGRNFNFDDCPTRVYGESDLAIAYIGTLGQGETDSVIAARGIVWPDKKLYGRTYGDTATLEHVLSAAGYTYGSMRGARIQAIETGSDGQYVMPYVDGITSASLRGGWFVLNNSGEYDCQKTDGTTGETNSCAHCGDSCDVDEVYCQSCSDSSNYCEHCHETYFDSSDGEYSETRGEWRCNDCWESHDCQVCDHTFHEYEFSRRDWRDRNNDLCENCEHYTDCDTCGEYSDNVDEDRVCADCRKCSECGETCERAADRDSLNRCEDCADTAQRTRLIPARPVGQILRVHRAGVATVPVQIIASGEPVTVSAEPIGPLYVHRTVSAPNDPQYWTVTHAQTRLAVATHLPADNARRLAFALQSLDWAFTAEIDMPAATRAAAPAIIREYRA